MHDDGPRDQRTLWHDVQQLKADVSGLTRAINSGAVEQARLNEQVRRVMDDVDQLETSLKADYVEKSRFVVSERLIFGLAGLILMAVVLAWLKVIMSTGAH